jgi:hypothetical protein
MRPRLAFILAAAVGALTTACASTTAKPVQFNDRDTGGFRIYDPKPMLLVTDKTVQVFFVPNYDRGYAVRFWAFLSKNDLTMKTADGAMTELSSHIDTTAALTLFQTLGQEALKQVDKLKALGGSVEGTITGNQGVFEFVFDRDGRFTGLQKIELKTTQ